MIILLILTCLLSASVFTLSLFKRDKIWPRVSLLENIASSIGLVGSILLAVFYAPVSAGAAIIYSLSIAGALFGNFAPMILTLTRYADIAYKGNKKFKSMSIATWVIGIVNIILTIVIGVV